MVDPQGLLFQWPEHATVADAVPRTLSCLTASQRQTGRPCCGIRWLLSAGVFLVTFVLIAAAPARAQQPRDTATATQALTVLIGGFSSDPSPDQLAGTARRGQGNSGMYQLRDDLLEDKLCAAEYFNWNGTRAGQLKQQEPPPSTKIITQYIREEYRQRQHCRIVIVGNSWGGHTAWEVCTQLAEEPQIPVDMLVFLDPSSAGRASTVKPVALPENVLRAVNYYTRNIFVWREWPMEQRLTNIDLGDPVQGYLSPARPYDGTFNWQAHVAAEWDNRIHADIRARIRQALSAAPPNTINSK